MEEIVPWSVIACSGWPACGDLRKVKCTSGPQEYAPGWEEHTHKQPQHPAVPWEAQCEGCFPLTWLLQPLRNSARKHCLVILDTKWTVLSGNLLGPAHRAGQILGLIRKKPL